MTYKQWDKVIFKWQEHTYVCEYRKHNHMIDWCLSWSWHDGKITGSISWAKENSYTFVWNQYRFVSIDQLSPIPNKKVTDLCDREVIHCETEEEAIRICRIMHEAWLTWSTRADYIKDSKWNLSDAESWICYRPKRWQLATLDFYKAEGCTIHSSKDFPTEIKEWDAVFIDDKLLTQKTPTPFYNLTKPIMSKLATFRNKLFFTDKKMQSLAELTQEGSDVMSSIQGLANAVENIKQKLNVLGLNIEEFVDDNNIDQVKNYEKQLKQLIKSIKGDKTMEVLLNSAEVVEKFNASI